MLWLRQKITLSSLILTGFASFGLGALAQSNLPGWSETKNNKGIVLSKGGLKLYIENPVPLGSHNLQAYAINNKASSINSVQFLQYKQTTSLPGGGLMFSRIVKTRSGKGASMLAYCPSKLGNKGAVRRIELAGTLKAIALRQKDFSKATHFIAEICPANKAKIDKIPSHKSKEQTKPHDKTKNTVNLPKNLTKLIAPAKLPSGLKDIRGLQIYGIQAGGMFGLTEERIALFKDGSFTTDLHGVFKNGVKASKARNPKKWGKYRLSGKKLSLKEYGKNKYEKTIGQWVARPGGKNQKLHGCFGRIVSSSGFAGTGSTMVGRASSWCFDKSGRFSHSSTGFGTSKFAVVSSSPPGVRGRYRIDGYGLHLVYDDGSNVNAAFSFLDKKHKHIDINGRRFMGN